MFVKVDMADLGFENLCMETYAVLVEACGGDHPRALKLASEVSSLYARRWHEEYSKGSMGDLENGLDSRFSMELFLAIPYIVSGSNWNLNLFCSDFRDFCAVHPGYGTPRYLSEILNRMSKAFEAFGDLNGSCAALREMLEDEGISLAA